MWAGVNFSSLKLLPSGHSIKNKEPHTTQSPLPPSQTPKPLAAVCLYVSGNGPMIPFILEATEALFSWACFWTLCFVGCMHVCTQGQNTVPSLLMLKLSYSFSDPPSFFLFAELGVEPMVFSLLLCFWATPSALHSTLFISYKDLSLLFVIMYKKEVCVCMLICAHVCRSPWRSETSDVLELEYRLWPLDLDSGNWTWSALKCWVIPQDLFLNLFFFFWLGGYMCECMHTRDESLATPVGLWGC